MKQTTTRLLSLLTAAALVLSLAACGGRTDDPDPSADSVAASGGGMETLDPAAAQETAAPETQADGGQTAEPPSGGQAVTPTQAGGTDRPTQSGGQTVPAGGIRETTDRAYVLKLYQDCLANVNSQKPGHVKKEYQAITNHNLGSGIGGVLSLLETLNIFKTEDSADARETPKGDKEQGRMLKCTLSNISVIKSASCVKAGGGYKGRIVAATAVDPGANSEFAKIMKPLTHSEIDETLQSGAVKAFAPVDGYRLTYRDCTIEFTINEKKQFQSLSQTMPCDINAWGRIGLSSRKQADPFKATLTNYVKFSSFKW